MGRGALRSQTEDPSPHRRMGKKRPRTSRSALAGARPGEVWVRGPNIDPRVHPRKRLGQNFEADPAVATRGLREAQKDEKRARGSS